MKNVAKIERQAPTRPKMALFEGYLRGKFSSRKQVFEQLLN